VLNFGAGRWRGFHRQHPVPTEGKEEQAMAESTPTDVFVAFEILLKEIEEEIDFIDKVGAEAFGGHDYVGAHKALERAGQITAFREKIVALREEWETLDGTQTQKASTEEALSIEHGFMGRLQRGLRTPEKAFYQPILKILNEQGGSAKASDVLEKLELTMKGILREVDHEPLQSGEIRWRKTANFARDTMVKKGQLKSGSPRSIWEISDLARMNLPNGAN